MGLTYVTVTLRAPGGQNGMTYEAIFLRLPAIPLK